MYSLSSSAFLSAVSESIAIPSFFLKAYFKKASLSSFYMASSSSIAAIFS